MRFRSSLCMAGMLTLALGAQATAVAAQPGEFLVTRPEDSRQANPAAAFGPGGVSLVVWEDSRYGIQGQLYGAGGARRGAALALAPNQLPPIPGEGPAVFGVEPAATFLPSGGFLVAWTSESGHLRVAPFHQDFDRAERRVMVRRFRPDGEPAGPAYEISAEAGRIESWPRLHTVPGGPVLAVWRTEVTDGSEGGLVARHVARHGVPLGGEVRVSAPGDAEAQYVSFAQGADGKTLLAWEGCCDGGDDLGVFARVYDNASRTLGPIHPINAATAQKQRRPAIATDGDRGFLVVWQGILDRTTGHIFGRFVDLGGEPSSGQFRVSQGHGPVQVAPAIAPTPGGGFLAVWRDWVGVVFGVSAVELDAAGQPVGEPVRLNTGKTQKNGRTSLAADGSGRFLVPWEVGVRGRAGIGARRLNVE